MKNKIALVTGANRGIGKEIATNLANIGIKVIGTTSKKENTNIANKHFKHKNIRYVTLNLKKVNIIEDKINKIIKENGAPNILINNAGILSDNLLIKMSLCEWENVININLTGPFILSKKCIKKMLKDRWGRIINISSVIAFIGNKGQANYSTSKSGIIGMTKSLAKEVAKKGITINNISPGFIDTDMTRKINEKKKNKIKSLIPMGFFGKSKDIYNAVEFLMSDKSSYITGETIHVNGGMYMK